MAEPACPYTIRELGERWGCSHETIRRAVNRGEIHAIRIGAMIRIPRAVVEAIECPAPEVGLEPVRVAATSLPCVPQAVNLSHNQHARLTRLRIAHSEDGGTHHKQ
jgi:excisionase family DNA binding protein